MTKLIDATSTSTQNTYNTPPLDDLMKALNSAMLKTYKKRIQHIFKITFMSFSNFTKSCLYLWFKHVQSRHENVTVCLWVKLVSQWFSVVLHRFLRSKGTLSQFKVISRHDFICDVLNHLNLFVAYPSFENVAFVIYSCKL